MNRTLFLLLAVLAGTASPGFADWNALILERIEAMPRGGSYAAYRADLPEEQRFDALHATVRDLDRSIEAAGDGALRVKPRKAAGPSFCSSATYLLFADVVAQLKGKGIVPRHPELAAALAWTGSERDVIQGKLDGVGIFGHWNADGPGTAVLFHRLGLGRNVATFEEARPGDFLKIFWNEHIGKGERGHLVVYLGPADGGKSIRVWSSNQRNDDGSSGYGTMTVERSRIQRALFSRLEHPENLTKWLAFNESEQRSDYLIRIRSTGSSQGEMHREVGIAP